MPLNEISPPPLAQHQAAHEILRVWALEGSSQECSLNTTWQDPAAWGLLLVDVARHVARAYANSGHLSEQQALERIWSGFNAERSFHTTDAKHVRG